MRDYILKKLRALGIDEDEFIPTPSLHFVQALESAVRKIADRKGLIFSGFWQDPDGNSCDLSWSLPFDPSVEYSEITESYKGGSHGWYIHVVNDTVDDLIEYINEFSKIDGVVCFSDLDDQLFRQRRSTIAVIVSGTPTHSFPFDCWSLRPANSKARFATSEGNQNRNEYWISPIQCRIEALVCCERTEEEVLRASKKIGCGFVTIKGISMGDET